jgi:hypothetical protein
MKYIKSYENINSEPQIGDYAIANSIYCFSKTQNFFKNTIGKIVEIKSELYKIEYDDDDIPDNISLDDNSFNFKKYEIIFFSSNKKDVDAFLYSNKYNL